MARKQLKLDDFLPYRLSLASNAVSQVLARAYESQHRLKMHEWRVLTVLAEVKQASQQQLVALTKMDKVTISRAARVLEKQQLLRRITSATDARSLQLSLTPRGWDLYERVVPTVRKLEAEVLAGVSARELTELKATLRRLEAAAARVLARQVG